MNPLITPAELHARMKEPFLAIVDGSWNLHGTDARDEHGGAHLPGAVFLDLETASDHRSVLPHMLPSPEIFASYVGAHGISNAHEIVVYDRAGCFSSPRWWWMFRVFGHEKVRVLDGGLPAWLRAGYGLTGEELDFTPTHFHAVLQPKLLATRERVEEQLRHGGAVLDARSLGRFSGEEKEPRAGLRSGHMKGAVNLHYPSVLHQDGTFRSAEEIRALVPDLKKDSVVITTCGSGVTACIIALALHRVGYTDVAVYDGSWAEWGASDLPVEAA